MCHPHCIWHRSHIWVGSEQVCAEDEEGFSAESWLWAQCSPSRWTAVLTVLFPTLFIFSFYFFLFSPLLPALLLLSLHSPCRLWPLWQPTDERSWVYSPLHYSAQLHSVSDEESDTVSVQQPCAGCPVGRVRVGVPSARSAWPLAVWGSCMAAAEPGCLSGQLCASRAPACSARAVAYSQLFGAGKALGSSGFPDMLPFLEDVEHPLWLCWEIGGTQT